jgi:hypothetical protein
MDESHPSEKESGEEKKAEGAPAAKKLTPEEQMEAYEKDLKENDWGHQPC